MKQWARIAALLGLCASGHLLAQVNFLGTQSVMPGTNLTAPYGVVEDAAGNIYVSDPTLHEVACFTATGALCGAPFPMQQGLSQPKGMAIDGHGDLFVADAGAGSVVEIANTPSGYANPVTLADSLDDPEAVALDPGGNLFVAVTGSGEIVKLALSHGQYGAPSVILQGLEQPVGIAFDAYFTMYLSDAGYREIYTSTQQFGVYSAPKAYMHLSGMNGEPDVPGILMMDASMVLYINDQTAGQVIAYQLNHLVPHPLASWNVGSGLQSPGQVAEDAAGKLILTDSGSGELVHFSKSVLAFPSESVGAAPVTQTFLFTVTQGTVIGAVNLSTAGNSHADFQVEQGSNCAPGTYAAAMNCSVAVGFSPMNSGVRSGAITFVDSGGNPLLTTYLSGVGNASRVVTLPATVTTLLSGLKMPTGVTVDGNGNLFVTDGEIYTVSEYSQGTSGVASSGALDIQAVNAPVGMAVDGAGDLFVASSGNDRVIRMAWNGMTFTDQQSVGTGMYVPSGVAVGANGEMCVADTYENQVDCYEWTGTSYFRQTFLFSETAGGMFVTRFPLSTAIDAAGDVFWVQPYLNGVTEFNSGKNWVQNLWSGYFQFPTAVAVDGEGDLYVLDSGHNRVMMMVPVNGVYQKPVLVAAGFNAPQGLAVDAEGNLYVADTGNHRVVKIAMTQSAPLVFTPTTSGGNSTASQTMQVLSVGAQPTTIAGVSYPQDFQAGTSSTAAGCSAGVVLSQGQICTVSATFVPQKANAQMQESIVIAAQGASGGVTSYAVAVQGTSASQASQTIQFAAQAAEVYGQRMVGGHTSFALAATSSSGLPVTFAVVSGPGVIAGGNTLEATGVGTIVVRATQAGNAEYAAANPVEQSFTVLPATLTVRAINQQLVYGATPPSFGYTITGFVGGDTGSVVSGNPTITSSAGTRPAVGSYAIQIQAGTLAAANYSFVFAPGTLTVTAASLTLTPNSAEMMMGSAVPALSYSATGLVGVDTLASATTGAPVLSTTATPQSLPGSYPILISAGTLQAKNYTITYQSGVLQVILLNSHGYNPPGGLAPPPFRLHGVPVLPFVGAGVAPENHGMGNNAGSGAVWRNPGAAGSSGLGWQRVEGDGWDARQGGIVVTLPGGMPGALAAAPLWGVGVSESSSCAQRSASSDDASQSAEVSRGGSGAGDYCAASVVAAPVAMEER